MLKKYKTWIDSYQGSIHRRCTEITKEMTEAFPELIRVRGFVYVIESPLKRQAHWWLKTFDGSIVDPTARQWAGIINYEPIDESRSLSGMCRGCGAQLYDGDSDCTIDCALLDSREFGETLLIVQADGVKFQCRNGRIEKKKS